MKNVLFLFVALCLVAYSQTTTKIIYWDVYSPNAMVGGLSVPDTADGIADETITVGVGDTVIAELYIDGLSTSYPVTNLLLYIQYGYPEIWKPSADWSKSWHMAYVGIDSVVLGSDSTMKYTYIRDTIFSHFILNVEDTCDGKSLSNVGIVTDTSLIKFYFVPTKAGRQVLDMPIHEYVGRESYTRRFWNVILNKYKVPYDIRYIPCVLIAE